MSREGRIWTFRDEGVRHQRYLAVGRHCSVEYLSLCNIWSTIISLFAFPHSLAHAVSTYVGRGSCVSVGFFQVFHSTATTFLSFFFGLGWRMKKRLPLLITEMMDNNRTPESLCLTPHHVSIFMCCWSCIVVLSPPPPPCFYRHYNVHRWTTARSLASGPVCARSTRRERHARSLAAAVSLSR